MDLHLEDADATVELGRILAEIAARAPHPPALLLQGDLGSGKTTLVRGLVASLPGSDHAEVSSPSFNIFNLYPTVPPVAHFDLYRLEGMPPDDALFEQLESPATLTVVEWAQFLDKGLWPEETILLSWIPCSTGRRLTVQLFGKTAQALYHSLSSRLSHFTQTTE